MKSSDDSQFDLVLCFTYATEFMWYIYLFIYLNILYSYYSHHLISAPSTSKRSKPVYLSIWYFACTIYIYIHRFTSMLMLYQKYIWYVVYSIMRQNLFGYRPEWDQRCFSLWYMMIIIDLKPWQSKRQIDWGRVCADMCEWRIHTC